MRIEDDNFWRNAERLPVVDDAEDDDWGDNGRSRGAGLGVLREVAETILLTLLIFFIVRAIVQQYKVEGESMMPTLVNEEYLLVNKGLYFRYDANFLAHITDPSAPADMRYLFHGPQRGDIIVFNSPVQPLDYIKRVIAVEGETVQIKADRDPVGDPHRDCGGCGVYVDGVRLDEPYIKANPNYDYGPTTVPRGQVFVLGDNRRDSSDSHLFGPFDLDRIIGTAFVAYWPQDHWGLLPHPTYAEIKK